MIPGETVVADIREKLERVRAEIERASETAGRDAREVRLLVVTKAQPVSKVLAAAQAGAQLFGENYPEETVAKVEALQGLPGVEWHMIGHLQSRKVKIVAQHFHMLHSLDSLSLAVKLNRALQEQGRALPVLLELNVSGEESKSGWEAWDEAHFERLLPDVESILELPTLRLKGLMTMPPLFDDPEQVRPFFLALRKVRDRLAQRFPNTDWRELSMGTSNDFMVAIQEGATYIRVGTAIMGPRPAKNPTGEG